MDALISTLQYAPITFNIYSIASLNSYLLFLVDLTRERWLTYRLAATVARGTNLGRASSSHIRSKPTDKNFLCETTN
jgi:hypothetical protein